MGEGGRVHEKQIHRGELPKKGGVEEGGLGEFADLRGEGIWQKRIYVGVLIPQLTL